MIILCNTLLPNDRGHCIQLKISTTIKSKPATDTVIDDVVAPILTTVSIDCNDEVMFYNFYFFSIYEFSIWSKQSYL